MDDWDLEERLSSRVYSQSPPAAPDDSPTSPTTPHKKPLAMIFYVKSERPVILQTNKSDFYQKLGWHFPGWKSQSKGLCGTILHKGCTRAELHTSHIDGISLNTDGQAFIKQYYRKCYDKGCPKCYRAWMTKEILKGTERLTEATKLFVKYKWPSHVTISPKISYWSLPYQELKKKAIECAKLSGLVGGLLIFHVWRKTKKGLWRFGPHFHFIAFGYVKWNRKMFKRYGFVVKRVSERTSEDQIAGTIKYQLSHCAVHEKYHSVVWFGCCNYAKLKIDIKKKKEICLICHKEMEPLEYNGRKENLPYGECYFLDDYRMWDISLRCRDG